MHKKFNKLSGQTLIEVLIAFAVVVIIGIALISASLATQRVSISARAKSQAADLAKAYLDQVRVIRDVQGYSSYFPNPPSTFITSTCYIISNSSSSDPATWGITTGCTGTTPNVGEKITLNNIDFYRNITFISISTTSATVQVNVFWTEGVNNRSVSQQTILTKWCGGPVSTTGSPCP